MAAVQEIDKQKNKVVETLDDFLEAPDRIGAQRVYFIDRYVYIAEITTVRLEWFSKILKDSDNSDVTANLIWVVACLSDSKGNYLVNDMDGLTKIKNKNWAWHHLKSLAEKCMRLNGQNPDDIEEMEETLEKK